MNPEDIINIVCQVTGIAPDKVKTTITKRDVVLTRRLAVHYLYKTIGEPYIIAKYFSCSLKTIYRDIGNFDKELQYNKPLRYLKSQCDKLLES